MANETPIPAPAPTTLVYLFSGDHGLDGELKVAQQLQQDYAKHGGKLIIIGDGQHLLSQDEVKAGFAQVSGNYNLVIGAHGMNDTNSLRLSFLPPGMTAQQQYEKQVAMLHGYGVTDQMIKDGGPALDAIVEKHDRELSNATWASAGDIFKILPPGVQSVMTTACHGQSVVGDTHFLPDGVPVLSVARSEVPALTADVDRGFKTFTADMAQHNKPMDMYLNYVVTGIDLGFAQNALKEARGGVLPAINEALPTEIAMAKGQSIDLLKPVQERRPIAISAASVDRLTDMLMHDSHQGTYYGVTDDGKPIRDAQGQIAPQQFTREAIHAVVQKVADRLGKGDVPVEAPAILYAGNDAATAKMRLVMQGQLAVGLVGAEVEARSQEKNINIVQAFGEVAPAVMSTAQAQGTMPDMPLHVLAQARAAATGEMQAMNTNKPAIATHVVVPQTQSSGAAVGVAR